jgi:hypothetical protein
MKSLLRRQRVIDFLVMAGLLVASTAVTYALFHHQRTLDLVEVNSMLIRQTQQTMEQVKAEVDRLNGEVRLIVEPLRGLSKSIRAVKDATEPVKTEGKP